MALHFLDKDMMIIIITIHQTKTGICRSYMVSASEKTCVEIRKNTENCN